MSNISMNKRPLAELQDRRFYNRASGNVITVIHISDTSPVYITLEHSSGRTTCTEHHNFCNNYLPEKTSGTGRQG